MKVYFIRHGESEYNVARRTNFDIKKKVPLTLEGRDEVKSAAEKLAEIRFDAIFSSQFLRAKETAEILAKGRRMKIRTDKRINEFQTGCEGEDAMNYWNARDESGNIVEFRMNGHESFLDVKKRVFDFLQAIKKQKYGRVLVVTHEAVIQAARAIFNELGDEESLTTPIRNAECFMFDM